MDGDVFFWVMISCLCQFAGACLGAYCLAPVWDRFSMGMLADFVTQMRNVGLDTTGLPSMLRWWGATVILTGFVMCFVLQIPLIGIAAVIFICMAPRFWLEFQIAKRRSLLRDQMVGASVALANSTRAGMSLPQGIQSLSEEAPQPLAAEFRRVNQDYHRGRPMPEALRDAKERLLLDGFTLFTSALLTCIDRGGRVTEALERISKSLQESQRLERKLEADTAAGRKTVLILTAFPVVFLGGFYLMDRDAVAVLFETIPGQSVVVAVLVLTFLSGIWAKKILAIEL